MEYLALLEKLSDPVLVGVLNNINGLSNAEKKEVLIRMLAVLEHAYDTIEELQYTRRTTSKPKRDKSKRSSVPEPSWSSRASTPTSFERTKPFKLGQADYIN